MNLSTYLEIKAGLCSRIKTNLIILRQNGSIPGLHLWSSCGFGGNSYAKMPYPQDNYRPLATPLVQDPREVYTGYIRVEQLTYWPHQRTAR